MNRVLSLACALLAGFLPTLGQAAIGDAVSSERTALAAQATGRSADSAGSVAISQPAAKGVDEQGADGTEALTPPVKPAPSLFEPNAQDNSPRAVLTVKINVPHNDTPHDVINAYPYPVKPPKVEKELLPLTDKPKQIRNKLIQSGYTARFSGDRPYPPGGWRWINAYRIAKYRSGLSEPHSIIGMYRWADEMLPYTMAELKKTDAIEKQRFQNYLDFSDFVDKNRLDIENEAVRQGLSPLLLRLRGPGWTRVQILPGNWWITCTRKVPGLTYYWQVPITLTGNQADTLMLTEANAMIITGGW